MKKITVALIWMMLFALAFSGCSAEKPEDAAPDLQQRDLVTLNVFAAASLTVLAEEYAKECGDALQFNYGGSGALQKQIEEGAPCDLFLSAATSNMDALEAEGQIDAKSRIDLLGNTLTLVASAEKKDVVRLEALPTDTVQSIAIGEVETVPAGKYAKQSFESLGIWQAVEPKLNYAKDVRAVLQYVDTGNVDCGLVYRTDAMTMESGVIIADLPADSYDPVVYPAAVTAESKNTDAAVAFLSFLQTEAAKKIFEEYGFTVR